MKRKPFNMTLDEDLIREAKKKAIDLGKPLYMIVEEALRLALHGSSETSKSARAGHGARVTKKETSQ